MPSSRGDQQFCLRWNSFHTNLAASFHALRLDEDFVDVTLAAEGQLIKAHRVILSACSPFFKEILKSAPCRHPVVVLHDVRAAHVRGLLRFMYEGQVNLTPEQMPEFLRAAQALHIKGLFEDMQQQQAAADGRESTSATGTAPAPPPPPLTDSRPSGKRTDSAADPPAKRARAVSPPLVTEPVVKLEPSSPRECKAVEEEEAARVVEASPAAESSSHAGRTTTRTTRSDSAPTASPSEPADRSSRHQPATSQEGGRGPSASQERGRSAASGGPPTSSPSCSSDPDYVVTHTAYPFPCPFCEKSYTSWGFRRRHIKAFHTSGPTLKCKWCWQVLPTHDDWCSHVTGEHHLSAGDAQHAIQILDEANLVLQSSEPLRLESLVDMVKRQQRRSPASPETALQGAASS